MVTPDAVRIRSQGFEISGLGMQADLGTQELRILSDVEATIF